MKTLRTVPLAARLCVLVVSLSALGCIAPAAVGAARFDWRKVLVLAVLYAACEQITRCPLMGRRAPEGMGSFLPALLAGAMMLPPSCAALVAVPGALIGRVEQSPKWIRRVWRAAQLSVSTAIASQAYRWAGGPRSLGTVDFPLALVHALLAAVVFCLVSGALTTGVLIAAEHSGRRSACGQVLGASFLPHLAYGVVGLSMVMLWQGPYGAFAAVLALLPMYVSCWVFAQYHRERAAHHATVRALVQAVDLKDEYTRGHSERVGRASVMIGREMGMPEERVDGLRFAGILHDVGKIGVPTRLLRKAGPLTPEERRAVELHPEYGHEVVRGITFLGEARGAILHHHERIDGSGYPYGLRGRDIPEFARVVAVADAFDAMTSTRSYRGARPVAAAVEELKRCAGSQFDPLMVYALARAVRSQGWVTASAADPDSTDAAPAPGVEAPAPHPASAAARPDPAPAYDPAFSGPVPAPGAASAPTPLPVSALGPAPASGPISAPASASVSAPVPAPGPASASGASPDPVPGSALGPAPVSGPAPATTPVPRPAPGAAATPATPAKRSRP